MSLSLPSGSATHTDSSACSPPWFGAWSAFLIVGCFYLSQSIGIFMVQIMAGLSVGLSNRVGGVTDLDQTLFLPLSLFLGTIGAAMVSWQVATSRAQPSMEIDWFWGFLGKSYDFLRLWRFALLGVSLGVAFFALTEYGVLPPDDLPQPLFDTMMEAPFLLKIGWVLMFAVLFPVVEETLFRGFLFTGLAQSWGTSVAGLLTTMVFVAVHMPKVLEYWPALAAVILMGTLTVLIRIRAKTLAPCIAMHCSYNGTLVAVAFLTQPAS
jgi:membrane protease YdiL (CAAX protease family)